MAKLKIEDLKKIKEKVQGTMTMRDGSHRVKVIIHMGTCGIASGARSILNTAMEEIEQRKLTDVILTTTGCAGLCSNEPMATIEVKNTTPVKYIDLTEEKMKEIFEEHIIRGKPIAKYALAQGSERTI